MSKPNDDKDEADANVIDAIKTGIAGISIGLQGTSNPKVSKDDIKSPLLEYSMTRKNRGLCLLINQKRFEPRTGQNTRVGTDVDADRVELTFRKLGFEVRRHGDLRADQMQTLVFETGKLDHSNYDCFVFIVLSHGVDGLIYGTDSTVSVETLTRPFRGDRCRSLAGKPKLFFFQACRGQKFDEGVEMTDSMMRTASGDISTKLPKEADFLLGYSTVPGYYAWRNNQDGSWFIQSLCRVLREHAPKGVELMHMMVLVNRLVATSYESCTDSEWTDGMKQMPTVECRLTRLLYFNRNKD